MIEYGIGSQNQRKLISKDDSGATSGDDIFCPNQRICLDRIISDHGLYAQFRMNNNFRYILTLPQSSDILVAQTGQTLGSYSIENQNIANSISWLYGTGISLSYEHVTLMKTTVWAASSTLINENVNIPHKSMRAIVLLFTNTTRKDSKEFPYPNITKVKLTIEGIPNKVYLQ